MSEMDYLVMIDEKVTACGLLLAVISVALLYLFMRDIFK